MKTNWKQLLLFLAIPLTAGGLAALAGGDMMQYQTLIQPPLSPPAWVFPVVWTVLYLLMGYGSYRIYISKADPKQKRNALILYGMQLLFNFLWPLTFFRLGWRLTAFFLLCILWVLIFLTIRAFNAIDERASDALLPYLLWVTFAGYLNLGVYLLN